MCIRDSFYVTTSPSMDILISSNLERLLYLLCGRDDKVLRGYMEALAKTGKYTVGPNVLAKLQSEFAAGCADDAATAAAIRDVYRETGYLCDTHTAVAVNVYRAVSYTHLDVYKRQGPTSPPGRSRPRNPTSSR